jgi:hypothetical protein
MNIARFDQLLISISNQIQQYLTNKHHVPLYTHLLQHDFNNLIQVYLKIRHHLVSHRWKQEARLPILPIKELKKQLHEHTSASLKQHLHPKQIAHLIKTAACFLNKDIIKIISDETLTQKDTLKNTLANSVFIPVTMLPSIYHHKIDTIIKTLRDLPTTFWVSIVGSQALFALLITISHENFDPKDIYHIMETRDLDIRVIAKPDISDAEFKYVQNKLYNIMKSFNPQIEQNSGMIPNGRYCTFTDKNAKFDLVLTTDNTEFSNCSVAMPLFDYTQCMFMDYTALIRLAKHEICIYQLENYITYSNTNALAYTMKLLTMLEWLKFKLVPSQQTAWSSMNAEYMNSIKSFFYKKYQHSAPHQIPEQSTQPLFCASYDDFPPLPSTASTILVNKTETIPKPIIFLAPSIASIPTPAVQQLRDQDFPPLSITTRHQKQR